MLSVAIVYEDDKPTRAFKGDSCLYNAYKWAHRHYCLNEEPEPLPLHKLPDYLKVTYNLMTDEQFNNLIK